MTEPSVIFAVDHGAESVGPILPVVARLLVEIDRRNTDESQWGNRPKAHEPTSSGSTRTQEVNT